MKETNTAPDIPDSLTSGRVLSMSSGYFSLYCMLVQKVCHLAKTECVIAKHAYLVADVTVDQIYGARFLENCRYYKTEVYPKINRLSIGKSD